MVVKPNYSGHRKDVATLEGYWMIWKAMSKYPRRILEMGVDKGGSLLLWNDMFAPIEVLGLDIDVSDAHLQNIQRTFSSIRILQFDQSDPAQLQELLSHDYQKPFDLIIDDCSHDTLDVFRSLNILWHWLNVGGAYVIEDWKAFEDDQAVAKIRHAVEMLSTPGSGLSSVIVTHALIGLIKNA